MNLQNYGLTRDVHLFKMFNVDVPVTHMQEPLVFIFVVEL